MNIYSVILWGEFFSRSPKIQALSGFFLKNNSWRWLEFLWSYLYYLLGLGLDFMKIHDPENWGILVAFFLKKLAENWVILIKKNQLLLNLPKIIQIQALSGVYRWKEGWNSLFFPYRGMVRGLYISKIEICSSLSIPQNKASQGFFCSENIQNYIYY